MHNAPELYWFVNPIEWAYTRGRDGGGVIFTFTYALVTYQTFLLRFTRISTYRTSEYIHFHALWLGCPALSTGLQNTMDMHTSNHLSN